MSNPLTVVRDIAQKNNRSNKALVPGRRHITTKNSGHPHGGSRKVWYERRCPAPCLAVTRGSLGFIRACSGGSPDATRNNDVRHGCGLRWA